MCVYVFLFYHRSSLKAKHLLTILIHFGLAFPVTRLKDLGSGRMAHHSFPTRKFLCRHMDACHAIKNLLLWSYMRKRTSYGGGGGRKGAGNGKKKVEEGCRKWSPDAADSGPGEEKCCCSLHPWLRTCVGFEVRPHSEVKTSLLTGHVTLDKSPYFFECRFLYPKLRIQRVTLLIQFNLIDF